MLNKMIQIRVDDEILKWLDYIRQYNNNYKDSNQAIIRTLIMREYNNIKKLEKYRR